MYTITNLNRQAGQTLKTQIRLLFGSTLFVIPSASFGMYVYGKITLFKLQSSGSKLFGFLQYMYLI